uniref:Uncharacterized protein n=1 Tax=Arundo donax TaxID=35708 RepID=A0A0A9FQ91_ARUDO
MPVSSPPPATASVIPRVSDNPMETDAVAGDPMETEVVLGSVEEGRSNTDLLGHCSDSDSDSYSKLVNWNRSQFSYENAKRHDIPDYRVQPYPWEEDANEEGGEKGRVRGRRGGRGGRAGEGKGKEKEDKGVYFLKATDKSWSQLPERKRKRGRWDEHPRVMSRITAASPCPEAVSDPCPDMTDAQPPSQGRWDEHPRMVRSNRTASPSPERVVDGQPQMLCSSAEVLRVRMEMHECFEKGVSYRRLFKSKANKEELFPNNTRYEPNWFCADRYRRDSTTMPAPSYAHVFPKLGAMEPVICCQWVKPTTLKGDKQYIKFFHKLMEATEYGHTKDHVLAKAIVLARKSYQNMLFFQIDFAVEDCMKLLENEERMNQRYQLYYFAVSEEILNRKDRETVIKSIMDGIVFKASPRRSLGVA